ncbi:suppressor of fused domain protein, partial [Burkholderia cenocepacia]|uniref:suppressor of fused domain protein n=1 Tax=Burkholderia cenocepacia TaxID=95486 RepID=UPI001B99D5B8
LFLVRFISAVLLSGSWSWKPDFLGFLGNRRLQPSTTPGTLPGEKVNWLQGIPISDAELEILRTRGDSEFEDLLEQADVDVFDLYRSSLK